MHFFIIPRTRTKLGETAFSDCGPTTWNYLRTVDCIATFKRQLKTRYFNVDIFLGSPFYDCCIAGLSRLVVGPTLNN